MELNAQPYKGQESLKKNKLYQITFEYPVVTVKEEHEDSKPEIVDLEFDIPAAGKCIAAKEYRNKDFRASKAADILCIIFDDAKKTVFTQIFDIKRTITGFDETKPADELRREAVKRIKDFILQIQDSMIHKDGLTGQYVKYDGYKEKAEAGIISREFDQKKLERLENKLRSTIYDGSSRLGIAGKKYEIAAAGIKKDADIVRDFRNKKITVLGTNMDLKVCLLEYSAKRQGYYAKIRIGSS